MNVDNNISIYLRIIYYECTTLLARQELTVWRKQNEGPWLNFS